MNLRYPLYLYRIISVSVWIKIKILSTVLSSFNSCESDPNPSLVSPLSFSLLTRMGERMEGAREGASAAGTLGGVGETELPWWSGGHLAGGCRRVAIPYTVSTRGAVITINHGMGEL
jgi:hypothetical protein